MPWIREARRRLPRGLRRGCETFRFFFEPPAEVFPFLGVPGSRVRFETELEALRSNLRAYRDAVLKRVSGRRLFTDVELRSLRRPVLYGARITEYLRKRPAYAGMLEHFMRSPAESLDRFAMLVEEFHANVFLPAWAPINAQLSADIAMRQTLLRDFGTAALLRTLAPNIAVRRTTKGVGIAIGSGGSALRLNERSRVLLAPSFFCWPGHEAFVRFTRRGVQCTIAYPVPPLTSRTRTVSDEGSLARACDALADVTRVRIVQLLTARDLSTREVAGFLRIEEPSASRHLRVLLRARLVERARSGYFVMYSLCRERVREVRNALSLLVEP
ncbi:MAG: winged helix-turn-helix transcriptional regulator [Candidatus Eremiobacteraeota bacterium]|nr:winged helix-turn-helix transcriptional regulator [Candidatus Eremiobacteraeota bacterium]